MSFLKKRVQETPAADASSTTTMEQDVEAVMKKYDRESNVRVWEGTPKKVIRLLMALFSLFSIWTTLFSTAQLEVRLAVFLGSRY